MAPRFSSQDVMMGDKVTRAPGPISFRIEALAQCDIAELVVFRNNEAVFRQEPGAESFETEWSDTNPPGDDRLWYYTRIRATDDELAWSSPIWFLKE